VVVPQQLLQQYMEVAMSAYDFEIGLDLHKESSMVALLDA